MLAKLQRLVVQRERLVCAKVGMWGLRTKANEKKIDLSNELIERRHDNFDNKYSRRESILLELKELKMLVESNRNNFVAINDCLKNNIFNFSAKSVNGETSAKHDCESMRRIIWICDKFLNDSEKLLYKMDDSTLSTFELISDYYFQRLSNNGNSFTIEEMCDILWVYSKLGFRPNKLINKIISKIDKIFIKHQNQLSSYYQLSKDMSDKLNDENNENKIDDFGKQFDKEFEKSKQDFENYGFVPGSLKLPMKSNEFSDLVYSYGSLRIENSNLIRLLEIMIYEHFMYKNRILDTFLPKDLTQMCLGYAMYDPAFHFYTITWGLNRHLNLLGNHVNWTFNEKLQILHYDVAMRYINKFWGLQIGGNLQKLIDDSFVNGMEKIGPPLFNNDKLMQSVYSILKDLMLDDQYYCKNVEGYQIAFSRWESRDEPCLIECQSMTDHFMLDHDNPHPNMIGKILTGPALLRYHCMKSLFPRMETVKYYQWPQTQHLQQVFLRKKIYSMDAPMPARQRLLQNTLEPHYAPLHKGVYD